MDAFRKIAERKIHEAIKEGQLKDLPGKGKPLRLDDETWIPEDLRAAYRVLKNAGHIPPELELRNEIINLRKLIDTIDDDKKRLKKLRELNYKIMRLDMMRKRPLNLNGLSDYEGKLAEKFISS